MPFKKGQSGNPGGKPREIKEVVDLARAATPLAMATLQEIAGNPKYPPAPRVAASTALLDRAWGKPTQPNEHSGPNGTQLIPPALSVTITKDTD